jgi:hypothetical protein
MHMPLASGYMGISTVSLPYSVYGIAFQQTSITARIFEMVISMGDIRA